MKIAVLGARGRTGALVCRELEARGHEVVSVVRRQDETVRQPVLLADGRDSITLADGLRAQAVDAVAFVIGPRTGESDPNVMRESLASTLEAMRSSGVDRLVVVTADGPFRDSGDPISRFIAKPIVGRILANEFADIRATDDLARQSDVAWTVIRPPQLTDGTSRRARRRVGKSIPFGIRVSRLAVADAVVDALIDPATTRTTITVAR